jgi:hypothetical protein
MKKIKLNRNIILILVILFSSCQDQFEELTDNPNVAGEDSAMPPSYLLGRVLFEMFNGGGVADSKPGSIYEGPWNYLARINQYTAGNNNNYGGSNFYTWTSSATMYNQIKNINKMEEQALRISGVEENSYAAIGKFLKAYSYIWYTQRVGDIPLSEAGKGLEILTPKFDTQQEVYKQCIQLLDEANADIAALIPTITTATNIDGDIFYANDLKKWQKAINTYKLRVLISLSKRADDTPDLNIKQKFKEVIDNPTQYPIFAGNSDNLQFKFNAQYNQYPTFYITLYADQLNIGKAFLDITTPVKDPRTFIAATPAPAELKAGKTIGDFSAYVGADNGRSQSDLVIEALAGKYSYGNYIRYLNTGVLVNAPEPYILCGYSEMCFNIAEAINRGWLEGEAADFYTKGINASLNFYGLSDGTVLPIGDAFGKSYGSVTVSVSDFLNHPDVVYKGNNPDGLTQILKQKYVAMFQNSGWEPFYNQRRTGVPVFSEGPGINASQKIPKRWKYPSDETKNNPENATEAIQRQFGGEDDLNGLIWMIK